MHANDHARRQVDERLSRLSGALTGLKGMAEQIGDTLDEHNAIIDDVTVRVDTLSTRTRNINARIADKL